MTNETPSHRGDCVFWPPGNLNADTSALRPQEALSPPCRVCGDPKWVGCYWPEHPERAICVECCATAEHHDGETGHVWTYDPGERDRVCDHCGQFARNTDYYDHGDDW